MKHTKGPWQIKSQNPIAGIKGIESVKMIIGNIEGNICFTVCELVDENDASLIAAAPELLLALKQLLGTTPYKNEYSHEQPETLCIEAAFTAIAKAEGKIK
jgi:hypothetical protein